MKVLSYVYGLIVEVTDCKNTSSIVLYLCYKMGGINTLELKMKRNDRYIFNKLIVRYAFRCVSGATLSFHCVLVQL